MKRVFAIIIVITASSIASATGSSANESANNLKRTNDARMGVIGLCKAMMTYRKVLGDFPLGDYSEIMKALTDGDNLSRTIFFIARQDHFTPRGEFLDPWGTPYRIGSFPSDLPWAYSCGPNKIDEGEVSTQTTLRAGGEREPDAFQRTVKPPNALMRKQAEYDDEYPTCDETYATLRIMGADLDPDEITQLLGVKPSETIRAGTPRLSEKKPTWEHSGWYLTSSGAVMSRDLRRHLDWLLEQVGDKCETFQILQSRGYLIDLPCFWASKQGHGGPTLSPRQMSALGALGVELWIDLY